MHRRGGAPACRRIGAQVRLIAATAAVGFLLPDAASAQVRRAPAPSSDYWSFYLLPYPMYNSLEGLELFLSGGWRKAAPPGPIPVGISIEPTAQIATSGTRGVQLVFDQQGRWPGWRLLLSVGSVRAQRTPYFGVGNGSLYEGSLESAYGLPYYTYSLLRTTALATVRRRVAGPLHVQAGAQWRHYRARPLEGRRSRLADDLAAGVHADTGSADGLEARAGLLFDTRDEEASPSRGVFIEALASRGLRGAGDFSYTRFGLSLREFIPLGWYTSLAFRQSVEISDGTLPYYVSFERLTSWRPEDGFGGVTTLRTNLPGRWAGPNKALVSIDLRYKKWDFLPTPTTPVRLWLIAFADAGRVWGDGERFAARHLHTGYGVGARLQVGRGGIFGFDLGWSPDAHIDFQTAVSMAY